MAHFAKVQNGIVTQVIVAEQDFIDTLPDSNQWVKTSYNMRGGVYYDPNTNAPAEDQSVIQNDPARMRKNFAGIGMVYDPVKDCFYVPKQFDNWVYDEEKGAFFPPIAIPNSSTFVVDENNTIHLKCLNWNQEETRWENKETINSTTLYIWNPNSLVWEENNN